MTMTSIQLVDLLAPRHGVEPIASERVSLIGSSCLKTWLSGLWLFSTEIYCRLQWLISHKDTVQMEAQIRLFQSSFVGAIRYLEPCSHVAIYQVYQLRFVESPICTSCRCSWRACRKVAEAEVTRSSQLTLSTRFSATTRPTTLIRSKCGKKNCSDPKTQLQTVSSWISCFLATEVTDALRLTSQGLKFSSGYPAEGGWVAGGMWCASREMSWEGLLKAVALYVWVSCGIRLEHSLEHDSSILSMTKYGSSGIGQVSQ